MEGLDFDDFDRLPKHHIPLLPPVDYPIPRLLKERLDEYAKHGVPTGDFLRAVLENNLREAVARADMNSQFALCAIVSYCYNHLPSPCWGSPEKVAAWLQQKREERRQLSEGG